MNIGFMRGRMCRVVSIIFVGAWGTFSGVCTAEPLEALDLAPGYVARSVELGVPFGGAMAFHPADPSILYLSAGNYGEQVILELDLDTETTRVVSGELGNIGGLAVLNNGDVVYTENMAEHGIFRARDINGDQAFFDDGEITELIAPIEVDATFSGAQMLVAPAGNAAGIPAGALLVQTADGPDAAEILVIENPETSPEYFPPGEGWFHGFSYNGGLAFTAEGHVLCGVSDFPVGRVLALVNSNLNDRIEEGEVFEVLTHSQLTNSISDLALSRDGIMLITENSGEVKWARVPDDVTAGAESEVGVLAFTNGTYLSRVLIDSSDGDFVAGGSGVTPTAYVGGFVNYPAATNLLAISPEPSAPAAASGWHWLE